MQVNADINLNELNKGLLSFAVNNLPAEMTMRDFGKHLRTKWPDLRVLLYKHKNTGIEVEEI